MGVATDMQEKRQEKCFSQRWALNPWGSVWPNSLNVLNPTYI